MKPHALSTIALSVLISLASTSLARADSVRCPESGRIVHEGDSFGEVLNLCGEPSFRSQSSIILRRVSNIETAAVEIEEWTYNFGPNRFIQVLRFEGGRLRDIRRGSYGSLR